MSPLRSTPPRLTPLRSSTIEPDGVITDEQFRKLASCISSIVWRTNFDGTRIIAPRWADLAGKPERELQSNGWVATLHPDDRLRVSDAVRGAHIHATHIDIDFRLCFRDGSYHWFRARAEPARNERGEKVGTIGIAHNVDDQKRAEAALVENEARLRSIIDAARVGTIDHDLQTGRLQCSRITLQLLGLTSDVGLTIETVVSRMHPDDRPQFASAAEAARGPDGTGGLDIVFRSVHNNGEVVWISTRGTFFFEGTGRARRAVRFVGVACDVSARIRGVEDGARLSSIVASSNDAIIATTVDNIVTHWNAAAERVYGFTAAEMLGHSIVETMPPELVDEAVDGIEEVKRGNPISGLVTERLTKSGDRITVSLTLSPIYDSGVCMGVSSVVRDITDETRLQAEVAQAQKMEAIGQLAGGVAHDLNNILTAVLVGIELACQSANVDAETRGYFNEVRLEGLRAAGVIRQLLAVAKRQVINPRPCSFDEILRDLEPVLCRLLGEHIELVTTLGATRGIFADPPQISQVILNLAVNARDAMPAGGRLLISTSDDLDGEKVVMRITDTGIGMTPEVQARLFEPFFSTKGPGAGTGLGLSTTYGIVAQSHGTISVESKVAVGTTISVSLPCLEEGILPLRDHQTRAIEDTNAAEPGCHETILVVEDDRVVREQVVRGLARLGYHVIEAKNGRDALAVLQNHKTLVDIVVTDLVMPEMSGAELVQHVRAWYPTTRALVISGYSDRAVRLSGVRESEAPMLQKPFELSVLAAKVREILDQRGALRLLA